MIRIVNTTGGGSLHLATFLTHSMATKAIVCLLPYVKAGEPIDPMYDVDSFAASFAMPWTSVRYGRVLLFGYGCSQRRFCVIPIREEGAFEHAPTAFPLTPFTLHS